MIKMTPHMQLVLARAYQKAQIKCGRNKWDWHNPSMESQVAQCLAFDRPVSWLR